MMQNVTDEDTSSCKLKCPVCNNVITEAQNIPVSEKTVALLSLSSSTLTKSHLAKCGADTVEIDWADDNQNP